MTSANVTKSVRLRTEESEELARLSQATLVSESALMKQWIQEGIQAKKLDLAIQAYMDRKTDLRGGAFMAGVSYNQPVHAGGAISQYRHFGKRRFC